MKTTIYKIILWILFGFIFISAVHAIIESLIYVYLHYGFSDKFLDIHFQYYTPAFTFILTFIFSLIILLYVRKKVSKKINLEDLKYPWILSVISLIIAIVLKPIALRVSDKKLMLLYEDLSKVDYMSRLDFNTIFDAVNYSSYGSKWLLVILLIIGFLYLIKKSKEGNRT
ncbi:hypothetical protein [Winogradskyella sp. PG-2]|uniref:hypothetical protein n=1 Tax=Winogradskyella sp. PG-2 TaxID=754409 RepID=UPI0004586997|nr:hypothetical protein [Winogradskyella sp. PG-2]BAO74456.1 hypothetical protein WPG_0226 [Winogradskyella sp. PG-2]